MAGLSAYEGPVLRLIQQKWAPLVDEATTSPIGSLQGQKRGRGRGKRPSIMVATHMDAIGSLVTSIADGVLHVDEIGGIDPRILPGTPVIVHGKRELPGVVALPPLSTLPEEARAGAIGLRYLLVDVGLPPARVAALVRVGDVISFATPATELAGETISGHSLDNRASVAALTVCLEYLQTTQHDWDVWAVATSQEEETLGGAATSAFGLHPDLAVVLDVTFAKGPGADGWQTAALGKGPTLGWGLTCIRSCTSDSRTWPSSSRSRYRWSLLRHFPVQMPMRSRWPATGFPRCCWAFRCATCTPPRKSWRSGMCSGPGACWPNSSAGLGWTSWMAWFGRMPMASRPSSIGGSQLRLLAKLCNANGVSGDEGQVRRIVLDELRPEPGSYRVDAMGNLLVERRGRGVRRLRVMLDAHMDEVGFMLVAEDAEVSISSVLSEVLTPAPLWASRWWWDLPIHRG